jgi:hypothetical protein
MCGSVDPRQNCGLQRYLIGGADNDDDYDEVSAISGNSKSIATERRLQNDAVQQTVCLLQLPHVTTHLQVCGHPTEELEASIARWLITALFWVVITQYHPEERSYQT